VYVGMEMYKRVELSKRKTTSGFIKGGMKMVYIIQCDIEFVLPGDTYAIHATMVLSKIHLKCES
jgi:hypothetical protein